MIDASDFSKSGHDELYSDYKKYLKSRHPMSIKMNYSQWLEHEKQKLRDVEKKWSEKNLEKWMKDND